MIFREKQGDAVDRYLAWLQTGGEEIFETESPKLLFWGFVVVMIIVIALAVIGWPIREVEEAAWQNGSRF